MTSTAMSGMSGMSASSTASAAMASSTAMSMGDMGSGSTCKISMLWNWYTVNACFLSSQWQVTSDGMMAGSCIGVICLVMALEGLRRAAREYDSYIIRSFAAAKPAYESTRNSSLPNEEASEQNKNLVNVDVGATAAARKRQLRPGVFQQLIRAMLHMLQFAVAYFIMLLAMYFNGYIIISILIGAFLGAFIFSWQSMGVVGEDREITFCCG